MLKWNNPKFLRERKREKTQQITPGYLKRIMVGVEVSSAKQWKNTKYWEKKST